MKKIIIALVAGGLMSFGAVAAPVANNGAVEASTATVTAEAKPDVTELLKALGHDNHADAINGKVTLAQGFPWPPQGGGACEGYVPPPGCTVSYNDGNFCVQYCSNPYDPWSPSGGIAEICSCAE